MKALTRKEAIGLVDDGTTIMVGGFLGVGTPEDLIDELIVQNKRDLTIICNDTSFPEKGVGRLIVGKNVRKCVISHMGTNPETQRQMIENELDVELVPQGTLAERIRAGGVGLGGVLTPTGVGTIVEDGKKVFEVNGERYLVELPIKAKFAVIRAKRADCSGNLEYSLTARNFNPLMALAAETVIAEVDEIVPIGVIPPDGVHTPGVLVDYVVVGRRA